ncbi:SDR family oxidoreductase [Bacillus niameyensis]|uniref:SDR family oxidoreductase n=1 Tax=Bacillus niameyensis TaxID=1522308 RepID=UPI000780AC9D|nr:SDR family oxidoreductase [Bacillus niameyensis]
MRHAIITAGSKGIGRKVTEHFLQNGCSVTINYRSDFARVQELMDEWKLYEDRILFIRGDITKKADIQKIVEQTMVSFGRIDYFINNAGPYIFVRKKLVDYEDYEWYEMIEGNLSAVFHFSKLIIPIMRQQQFGRIVTYGFQDADQSPAWIYRSAYSAAKVGLVSLTKTIAIEEANFGITANMICPGDIEGEMKESDIEFARKIKNSDTPIGRSGTGEDIARLIGFICEEDSDMITGSVISATGGVEVIHRHRQ